jgi:hypothetical protein
MRVPIYVVALLVLVAACGDDTVQEPPPDSTNIAFRKDGTLTFLRNEEEIATINIEIAESDSARTRGLMQRTSLPDMSGMLFIFAREEPQSFWMGNTPLALDLIFVDSDSQIVDIDKYNKPYSSASIVSDAPAQYVVEVPAGFADMSGISESHRVRWTRTDND